MIATDVVAVVVDDFTIGRFDALPPTPSWLISALPNGSNEILPEAVM